MSSEILTVALQDFRLGKASACAKASSFAKCARTYGYGGQAGGQVGGQRGIAA